jgi:hypothetical protein
MTIHLVSTIEEVLDIALQPARAAETTAGGAGASAGESAGQPAVAALP